MTCTFTLTLAWGRSLASQQCRCCPRVESDCHLPGCVSANGKKRNILTFNGTIPGPRIMVCEGDTIRATIYNGIGLDSPEGTAVHWHGMHQRNTQWHDGVALVTQCLTPPGSHYTHVFKASPPGTHLYHAQFGSHGSDGAAGALVVRSYHDPHRRLIDLTEHVIVVQDWISDETFASRWVSHEHDMGSHEPDDILINGRSWHGSAHPTTSTNSSSINGHDVGKDASANVPLSVFYVEPNQRYRFRIISNGVLSCPIKLTIENHTLTVIATDGTPVEAEEFSSLVIFTGERYDFILDTARPVADYAMEWMGLHDCLVNGVTSYSILSYHKRKPHEPPQPQPQHPPKTQNIDHRLKKQTEKCPTQVRILNPVNTEDSASEVYVKNLRSVEIPAEDKAMVDADHADNTYYILMDYHNHSPEQKERLCTMNTHQDAGQGRHSIGGHVDGGHSMGGDVHWGHRKRDTHGSPCETPRGYAFNYSMHSRMTHHEKHMARPQLNGMSWSYPVVPVLTQPSHVSARLLCNGSQPGYTDCDRRWCSCPHTIHLPYGHSIDLVVIDKGTDYEDAHPMHIHGHSFYVMEQEKLGAATTEAEVRERVRDGFRRWRRTRPVLKDTVMVPDGGYVVLRFRADNPGYWLFHCHLAFHRLGGMIVMFKVGDVRQDDLPPDLPKCGSYDGEDYLGQSYTRTKDPETPKPGYIVIASALGAVLATTLCLAVTYVLSQDSIVLALHQRIFGNLN